jgi:hypothetical protein
MSYQQYQWIGDDHDFHVQDYRKLERLKMSKIMFIDSNPQQQKIRTRGYAGGGGSGPSGLFTGVCHGGNGGVRFCHNESPNLL